jgi:hypothetical protein
MIVFGHIFGIPVEENLPSLFGFGAVGVCGMMCGFRRYKELVRQFSRRVADAMRFRRPR